MDAGRENPQIDWASERHLRIAFDRTRHGQSVTPIDHALSAIEQAGIPALVGITPAYSTLLLEFDLERLDEPRMIDAVRNALASSEVERTPSKALVIEIPVCYDDTCAPDAAEVARLHGITRADLIRLHSEASYVVEFIGFVPGFGYLSGLPPRLNTPRLDVPRTRVPAGSVAIAANQTGVYPGNTAGGWRLIGRTPLRMFDATRSKPSLLARSDTVRFNPISLAEFRALSEGSAVP